MARNRFSSISHHASAWMQFQGNLLPSTFLSISCTSRCSSVQVVVVVPPLPGQRQRQLRGQIYALPLWSFAAASAAAFHSREENEFCSPCAWALAYVSLPPTTRSFYSLLPKGLHLTPALYLPCFVCHGSDDDEIVARTHSFHAVITCFNAFIVWGSLKCACIWARAGVDSTANTDQIVQKVGLNSDWLSDIKLVAKRCSYSWKCKDWIAPQPKTTILVVAQCKHFSRPQKPFNRSDLMLYNQID